MCVIRPLFSFDMFDQESVDFMIEWKGKAKRNCSYGDISPKLHK